MDLAKIGWIKNQMETIGSFEATNILMVDNVRTFLNSEEHVRFRMFMLLISPFES